MKAPAFQLYAADFYMDTASWTCNQIGAYIRLLMYEWINGALPPELSHLSRIAGIDIRNMQKMWSAVLAKKFILDDANMLVNPRLEIEREKQYNYRKSQEESGRRGGKITQEKRRNIPSEPSSEPSSEKQALQSSSSSLKKRKKKFIPPSRAEVVKYFFDNGYSIDVGKRAFEGYSVADWHDTNGKPVLNWKQKMNYVWFKDENRAPVQTSQKPLTMEDVRKGTLEKNG